MSCVSCKIHISDRHFLNGAVVNDKLRPPIFTDYFELDLRDGFEILGGVSHDHDIFLSDGFDYQKALTVYYGIGKSFSKSFNLCITEVNIPV